MSDDIEVSGFLRNHLLKQMAIDLVFSPLTLLFNVLFFWKHLVTNKAININLKILLSTHTISAGIHGLNRLVMGLVNLFSLVSNPCITLTDGYTCKLYTFPLIPCFVYCCVCINFIVLERSYATYRFETYSTQTNIFYSIFASIVAIVIGLFLSIKSLNVLKDRLPGDTFVCIATSIPKMPLIPGTVLVPVAFFVLYSAWWINSGTGRNWNGSTGSTAASSQPETTRLTLQQHRNQWIYIFHGDLEFRLHVHVPGFADAFNNLGWQTFVQRFWVAQNC